MEIVKSRTPEQIRRLAFKILKNHAFGTLHPGFKAANLIDQLIELDPTLEEADKDGLIPLVEMRKQIEKMKLAKG